MNKFFDIAKIITAVGILIGVLFGLNVAFDGLTEYLSYSSTKSKSVSAGIITDKEIINGHAYKAYVPTAYRIHISAEFEYKGETYQDSNYFDVSENVYNSYAIGDYFDSKDLLGNSEPSSD